MSYRDDEDALLARVDALEAENRRLQAEIAKRDAPAPTPPKPPKKPKKPKKAPLDPAQEAAANRRVGYIVLGVVGAAATIGVIVMLAIAHPDDDDDDDHTGPSPTLLPDDTQARWRSLLAIEPCLDDLALDARLAADASPERYDPLHPRPDQADVSPESSLADTTPRCADDLAAVALDDFVPANARVAIADLLDASRRATRALAPLVDYYTHKDYQDDQLTRGRGLWHDAEPAFGAWRDEVDRARDVAVVALDQQLDALAEARPVADRDRDLVYWRLHLGLAWRAMVRVAIDQLRPTSAEGDAPLDRDAIADALVAPFAAFRDPIARAPLEIRRDYRELYDVPAYVRSVRDPAESIYNLIISDLDPLAHLADDAAPAPLPPR